MTIDELGKYGMSKMSDDEVEGFLSSQSLGVLGLATGGAPYMIPMSYGFDGGSCLYFFFVVGAESRKENLVEQSESASFLVYNAETMFHWQSVILTGTIQKLPEDKRADIEASSDPKWRPELFETASEMEGTHLFQFQIKEWSGIRHVGLPPGFAPRQEEEKQN
ncbi:pyridoxamine 5'-phosphate oxidase family protein [Haloarcula sp. S1AR25-5A]|uniref:Pyridoxamine 5'-phosphate oxidase family protein n=1 Tax=Haloarcula terrestris TaxID=2950533 RepID=A0AAE4JJ60_9EURY|nr:pyridoxamine 5'-phosphate oxidase family protein [Haloarcula terrestris]MDS0223370.1 pyridoxamine 5'-phosphate oxidase family protein [Haloarcula terrestris]